MIEPGQHYREYHYELRNREIVIETVDEDRADVRDVTTGGLTQRVRIERFVCKPGGYCLVDGNGETGRAV